MKIHFIGIGGIGLSALAKFLANDGHQISGSDIKQTEITDELALNFGAKITIPHHQEAINGVERVIYSAAIRPNNPEYQKAQELGIELLSRKESLKTILDKKEVYAVGGLMEKVPLQRCLPQSSQIPMLLSAQSPKSLAPTYAMLTTTKWYLKLMRVMRAS